MNTRQQFNKILVKSGIGVLKNAFKVFRSSCVTDWARDHAVHVVAAWAGHTVAVAGKHYLTLTDSDWVKATSSMITLNPTVASTGSSISQAAQIVGVFSHESPEKPATSVTQKVTQKVTYSVQEMTGKMRKTKSHKSLICKKLPLLARYCLLSLSTRLGFEPRQRKPKFLVLPLHYRVPINSPKWADECSLD